MSGAERRHEPRFGQHTRVFVEVCAADPDGLEPANVQTCHSLDLSAGGMRLDMAVSAPEGCLLRLFAEPPNDQQTALSLVGEVKWSRPTEQGYRVGFELIDSQQSDIELWRERLNLAEE